MAGMLPGVECARRRRFHQSGGEAAAAGGGTRRPAFCLYASKHEGNPYTPITPLRSVQSEPPEDKKLGGVAQEAKERLDERLRTQRKWSDSKRQTEVGSAATSTLRIMDARTMSVLGELQTEVVGAKLWRWGKMRMMKWKAAAAAAKEEEEECTICLDGFRAGDHLVHLKCGHRFHSKCLLPWLASNAHCPCCRVEIHVEVPTVM